MFASLKNKIKEETTGNDARRRFASSSPSPSPSPVFFSSQNPEGGEKDAEALKKEFAAALAAKERQLASQNKEWSEKVASLQNATRAAQAVWSGEAAAARREARSESRKCADLAERLETATANAADARDRVDALLEELESERRARALERVELARAAEDALHRLSLAEAPSRVNTDETDAGIAETSLRRQLEETRLHLHDVKTSWSGRIAALETQVGRLSRQAGEEGSERRRAEKEKEVLLERLKEKDAQLERLRADVEDKEAKMALLAAEVGDVSRARREAREEASRQRDISITMENNVSELEKRLAESNERIGILENENKNLKRSIIGERAKNMELTKRIENEGVETKKTVDLRISLENKLEKIIREDEETKNLLADEKLLNSELASELRTMKEHGDVLKKEINEIHDRYDKERREKDEALIRNAHMSQTLEIYRQEMRQQDLEVVDMKEKIANLQKMVAQNLEDQNTLLGLKDQEEQRKSEMKLLELERNNALLSEKQLRECVKDLNYQLQEKTKNIRVLQNRLTDMKKTLQRELRSGQVDPLGSSVVEGTTEDPDVSKKYLKHVLIKFLTSREIEARQLTKAVSALLGLSEQEESLLRDTLNWRNGFSAWLNPPPRFSHS